MRVLGKAADLATAKRVLRARVRERCGDERVRRFLFNCYVATKCDEDDWPNFDADFVSYQRREADKPWEGFDEAVEALNEGAAGAEGPFGIRAFIDIYDEGGQDQNPDFLLFSEHLCEGEAAGGSSTDIGSSDGSSSGGGSCSSSSSGSGSSSSSSGGSSSSSGGSSSSSGSGSSSGSSGSSSDSGSGSSGSSDSAPGMAGYGAIKVRYGLHRSHYGMHEWELKVLELPSTPASSISSEAFQQRMSEQCPGCISPIGDRSKEAIIAASIASFLGPPTAWVALQFASHGRSGWGREGGNTIEVLGAFSTPPSGGALRAAAL